VDGAVHRAEAYALGCHTQLGQMRHEFAVNGHGARWHQLELPWMLQPAQFINLGFQMFYFLLRELLFFLYLLILF
jgi:hypothetical protein